MLVLNDTNDETGSVETIGKEEKGSEVGEGVSNDQFPMYVDQRIDPLTVAACIA